MSIQFSVIVPVHNKLPHLERSIFSVLNQTHQDLELILIDDASTDGSSEKLEEFKDVRINLLKRQVPGPGGYAARNLGVKNARHKWVCFLDADDEWEPDVLESLEKVIRVNPDVEVLCWGWTKVRDRVKLEDKYSQKYEKEKIKSYNLTDFFNEPQIMWTGSTSIKKELIDKAGGFPEQGFKRGGDMDTWIRCLWRSKKNLRITKPMSFYYLDSVNMVTNSIQKGISASFSDSITYILQQTNDKRLVKAIHYFQNKRIYTVIADKLNKGDSIDYELIRKMNISALFFYLLLKLYVKQLVVGIKNSKQIK